jgi:hypothetical protein
MDSPSTCSTKDSGRLAEAAADYEKVLAAAEDQDARERLESCLAELATH